MHYAAGGNPDTGLGASPLQDPRLVSTLLEDQATNGDAELVELELLYDSDPVPPPREAKLWGIPLWLVGVGGVAWAILRYYDGER